MVGTQRTDPQQALPVIYEVATAESLTAKLNPDQEKARLARVQTELKELDLAERRRELIASAQVESLWSDLVTASRAKLLGIPSKCAPLVFGAESVAVAEDLLKNAIHEGLSELSEHIPAIDTAGPGEEDGEALGAASEADGDAVGEFEEDSVA